MSGPEPSTTDGPADREGPAQRETTTVPADEDRDSWLDKAAGMHPTLAAARRYQTFDDPCPLRIIRRRQTSSNPYPTDPGTEPATTVGNPPSGTTHMPSCHPA